MQPDSNEPADSKAMPVIAQLEVVTGWFTANFRPQKIGEYEISSDPRIFPIKKAYWNGVVWCDIDSGKPYSIQNWQWRGLGEDPTTQKN